MGEDSDDAFGGAILVSEFMDAVVGFITALGKRDGHGGNVRSVTLKKK